MLSLISAVMPAIKAPYSMREAAGQSVKSSVSHTFLVDSRDDRLFPTRGFYLKAAHEIAGFGGDASFLKSETHAQVSRPIFPGAVGLPPSRLAI